MDNIQAHNTELQVCAFLLILLVGVYYLWRYEKYGRRRYWRHPSLVWEQGEYNTLFKSYKNSSHDKFSRYTRMEVWQFDEILRLLKRKLRKRSRREPVCPEERLAMTLKFLAHGGSLVSLSECYRRGLSTVQSVVKETCDVIWEILSPIYVNVPDQDGWKKIERDFWMLWNFPNCIGALDGKHIDIIAPPRANSLTFNYHERHSLVLMAMCDARYKFSYVDMGAYGSQNDSSVFSCSAFGQALLNNELNLPEEKPFPFRERSRFPFWLVADQAFPLSERIMRPYAGNRLTEKQRVFNYRLSRARRCIENTFGILVARWRLLRNRVQAYPETIDSYVKACICLHNFIITTQSEGTSQYCPPNYVDREDQDENIIPGTWRMDAEQGNIAEPLFQNITRVGANNPALYVSRMRDALANYLSSDGAVEWQMHLINAGYMFHFV